MLINGEKHTLFLINSFDAERIDILRRLCSEAIKNIPGARIDVIRQNGCQTMQINGTTEKAVNDAFTIIKLNNFKA